MEVANNLLHKMKRNTQFLRTSKSSYSSSKYRFAFNPKPLTLNHVNMMAALMEEIIYFVTAIVHRNKYLAEPW